MTDRATEFLELMRVEQLTPAEYLKISQVAGQRARQDIPSFGIAEREQALEESRICAFCGLQGATRNSRDAHGHQRYRCRPPSDGGCGRTFTALTGTPFSGLKRRDQWGAFLGALASGPRSLNALHASGEVAVSRKTLFRWRHRFLRALRAGRQAPVGGMVEADETYFRDSFKGSRGWKRGAPPADRRPRYHGASRKRGLSKEQIPVVTAIDYERNARHAVLPDRKGVAASLSGAIAPGSVLCTDGRAGYRRLARRQGLKHLRFGKSGRKRPEGAPADAGMGRVNQFHSHLKAEINHRLRGVSTALLTNYVEWLKAASPGRLTDGSVFATGGNQTY